MAISPKNLVTRIRENSADALAAAEKKTDKALEERFDWQYSVSISTSITGNLPPPVKEDFLNKYRAAGWDVTYHSDQRDGDFYTFKVAKNGPGSYQGR